MADIRSTDPNVTGYRRARFRIGWAHAVSGQRYSDDVLGNVTWQNTGWRLGDLFGETSRDLIDEFYELAVKQQAEQLGSEADPVLAPQSTEQLPFGFPIRDEFPNAEERWVGEGTTVFTASKDSRLQIIIDSGTLADFLDSDVDSDLLGSLVTVHDFDDESARDQYLAAHYPVS